ARFASQKDVESVEREEERVRRHLETLAAEAVQVDAERAETRQCLDELEGSLEAARDTEARLDRETTELGLELDGSRDVEASLVADATACRVDLAAVSERADGLGRDIDRLGELAREFDTQAEEAARRRAHVAVRRTDLGQERERTDAQAREAGVERDRWEAE